MVFRARAYSPATGPRQIHPDLDGRPVVISGSDKIDHFRSFQPLFDHELYTVNAAAAGFSVPSDREGAFEHWIAEGRHYGVVASGLFDEQPEFSDHLPL